MLKWRQREADETSGDQLEIGEYSWQMRFGGEKGKMKVCFFNPYAFIPLFFFSFSTLSRTSNTRVKESKYGGYICLIPNLTKYLILPHLN